MKKIRKIAFILIFVSVFLISIGFFFEDEVSFSSIKKVLNVGRASVNGVTDVEEDDDDKKRTREEVVNDLLLTNVVVETTPASLLRIEVYDGLTMQELIDKLNRSLGGILAGHGDVIATHSLEKGVDPYLVTAVMMHETGNGTSNIANNCYNFGGQKGSGCGAYKRYGTVDDGLRGIIDNLYKNYYAYGLTSVESIGHKYAESPDWPNKINWYIGKIRNK